MIQLTDKEFEEIYNQYFNELIIIAYSYTLDRFDAEDIVQDAFLKLYSARKTFNDKSGIKYWLIRVTINKSIDCLRKRKHIVKRIDDEYINNLSDTSSSDSSGNKDFEEIYSAVCLLKENYKKVIVLYYYDNYPVKEIASILKISESNVMVRLNRARNKLKELLNERNSKNGK